MPTCLLKRMNTDTVEISRRLRLFTVCFQEDLNLTDLFLAGFINCIQQHRDQPKQTTAVNMKLGCKRGKRSLFFVLYVASVSLVVIVIKNAFSNLTSSGPLATVLTTHPPLPPDSIRLATKPAADFVAHNISFSRGNLIHPGNLCTDRDLFLFIYVHSAPAHFDRRLLIRKTFANPENFPNDKLRVMFVFGAVTDKTSDIQGYLLKESAIYGDILQENFLDTYRNLSYKALSALHYVSENCAHVPFILKSDDDIFVNIFSLVRHLQAVVQFKDTPAKTIHCYVWTRMKVIRDVTSKWYVSPEEWQSDYYTHYCSGSAYVMTSQAAVTMYNASFHAPFLWVDDFYITGILTKEANVNLTSFKSVYKLHFNEFSEQYMKNIDVGMTYIFSHLHNLDDYRTLWNAIANRVHAKTVALF